MQEGYNIFIHFIPHIHTCARACALRPRGGLACDSLTSTCQVLNTQTYAKLHSTHNLWYSLCLLTAHRRSGSERVVRVITRIRGRIVGQRPSGGGDHLPPPKHHSRQGTKGPRIRPWATNCNVKMSRWRSHHCTFRRILLSKRHTQNTETNSSLDGQHNVPAQKRAWQHRQQL